MSEGPGMCCARHRIGCSSGNRADRRNAISVFVETLDQTVCSMEGHGNAYIWPIWPVASAARFRWLEAIVVDSAPDKLC